MKKEGSSIKLKPETYEFLKNLKEETGIPMTEAIERAVKEKYKKM